jgi:hypothetical protein
MDVPGTVALADTRGVIHGHEGTYLFGVACVVMNVVLLLQV